MVVNRQLNRVAVGEPRGRDEGGPGQGGQAHLRNYVCRVFLLLTSAETQIGIESAALDVGQCHNGKFQY